MMEAGLGAYRKAWTSDTLRGATRPMLALALTVMEEVAIAMVDIVPEIFVEIARTCAVNRSASANWFPGERWAEEFIRTEHCLHY